MHHLVLLPLSGAFGFGGLEMAKFLPFYPVKYAAQRRALPELRSLRAGKPLTTFSFRQ